MFVCDKCRTPISKNKSRRYRISDTEITDFMNQEITLCEKCELLFGGWLNGPGQNDEEIIEGCNKALLEKIDALKKENEQLRLRPYLKIVRELERIKEESL